MRAVGGVAEVAAVVRDAAAAGRTLRIVGAGRWLDAGHPVRAAATLDLSALAGIHAYTPADLTISVGAATTLAALDEATRAHGQWCPLLPWGDDGGSVGATVATATSGPFAAALGRPRDLVIGLECVDGLGRTVQAGGRVVKNVAGFDLVRTMTGSWGTLGAITALHLRLRARPAVDESYALTADPARDEALHAFVRGPYAPLACVALTPALAGSIGVPATTRWLVRIGGNPGFAAAARSALGALGRAEPVGHECWTALRREAATPARATAWRWDHLSLRLKDAFDPERVLNPGLLGDRT